MKEKALALRERVNDGSRRFYVTAIMAFAMALCAVGAFAQSNTSSTPSLPDTTVFDSTFNDVQTWSANMISGPGKYGIYIMLGFIGLGLVIGWIKKSVKVH